MESIPLTRPCEFKATTKSFQRMHSDPGALTRGGRIALAKYDGVCGIAEFLPGQTPRMLSRTGEDYSVSCRPVLDLLSSALLTMGADQQPWHIMGEVWRAGCTQPEISGDFRQQRGPVRDFEFRLFDMVANRGADNRQFYSRRRATYTRLAERTVRAGHRDETQVYPAAQLTVTGTPDEHARSMGPGYDGIVLWDELGVPLANEVARDGEAVKFKPTLTLDVRCTGGLPGKGKHAGRLGALTFTYLGRPGQVGTGLSDSMRSFLWAALNLGGQDDPVGKIIEVEAMGLTPGGNLREPRFKGIRFDKEKAD